MFCSQNSKWKLNGIPNGSIDQTIIRHQSPTTSAHWRIRRENLTEAGCNASSVSFVSVDQQERITTINCLSTNEINIVLLWFVFFLVCWTMIVEWISRQNSSSSVSLHRLLSKRQHNHRQNHEESFVCWTIWLSMDERECYEATTVYNSFRKKNYVYFYTF